jgi:AcrR family transcriptional regulator
MSSPLFDTLFRPTTAPRPAGPAPRGADPADAASSAASAAPVRVRGTRTRAGNAMDRTRTALLAGAARAVEIDGTRLSMAAVAAAAGVAKATLYNHFRTREAVLSALLVDQVTALVAAQSGKALGAALTDAATALSGHPLRRALASLEPAVLAEIARIDLDAAGWRVARDGVDAELAAAGLGGTDTVLRWLASFVVSPADPRAVAADVAVLLAGLPARTA